MTNREMARIIKSKSGKIIYHLSMPVISLVLRGSNRSRIILVFGGQILLERSFLGRQLWSVPGGGVEKGETLNHAAARELKEEVGIEIKPEKLIFVGTEQLETTKHSWSAAKIHFFFYEAKVKPAIKITRPIEIIEAKWFDMHNLPTDINPAVKIGLKLVRSKYRL